jgi:hypothetical protein
MKGMLEDIQLLAANRGMENEQITRAMMGMDTLMDDQKAGFVNNNTGGGSQSNFNAYGDQYNNPGSGKQFNAHTMSFRGD